MSERSRQGKPRLAAPPPSEREIQRRVALEHERTSFGAPEDATPEELVAMAIHELGYDEAQLAAALGISLRRASEAFERPDRLSRTKRALLAQFLEMQAGSQSDTPGARIAARLRSALNNAPPQDVGGFEPMHDARPNRRGER